MAIKDIYKDQVTALKIKKIVDGYIVCDAHIPSNLRHQYFNDLESALHFIAEVLQQK